MVRWLEANGYDISYFTGIDAATSGNLILNHKVFSPRDKMSTYRAAASKP